MRQIWSGRMAQAAAKYGEQAPMVGVCCNACRSCTTTNIVGLAFAGAGGLAVAVTRLTRRLVSRRSVSEPS